MSTHQRTASNPDDGKPFTRWQDRTARVIGIDTPRYYLQGMQPRTVDPSDQKPWQDNPLLCAKRDLKNMIIGEKANINGYVVERITKGKKGELYLIRGRKYTYPQALEAVTK